MPTVGLPGNVRALLDHRRDPDAVELRISLALDPAHALDVGRVVLADQAPPILRQ